MEAINAQELLSEATCYQCYAPGSLSTMLELALLSRIATLQGGGGVSDCCDDFQQGHYAGAEPDYTPTAAVAFAVDLDTERIWWYYNGSWH
jgi:hypothetical protein